MSDIVLRNTARIQVQLSGLLETLRDRLADQEGQDTIEYIGVLLVVATLIGVVVVAVGGLGDTIKSGATTLIHDVFTGSNGK